MMPVCTSFALFLDMSRDVVASVCPIIAKVVAEATSPASSSLALLSRHLDVAQLGASGAPMGIFMMRDKILAQEIDCST